MTRPIFLLGLTVWSMVVLVHLQGSDAATRGGTVRRTLFVFGDSLFDPGNNQYLNKSAPKSSSSYWPYGESFFKHPTGRISDGRIVPDFIAKFASLPMLLPYLQPGIHHFTDGANFASGGASVVTQTNTMMMSNMAKIDLSKQLSYFKEMEKSMQRRMGDEKTKEVLMRAVFLFSIGGNDYFSTTTTMPNATQAMRIPYVAAVIGNITTVLREIYGLGGRKIGFQNVGPLGCTPGQKATNPNATNWCNDNLSAFARLHNRELAVALKKLGSELPGFKYSIFDYYTALRDKIFNPLKYGFKEGQSACCGSGAFRASRCGSTVQSFQVCSNPREYVWFDGAHTTERANYQLAQLIWSGKPMVTGPYTFRQLFTL